MEGGLVDEKERIGSKRGRDEKDGVGRLEKRPSGIVVMEEYSYSYSGDEMINGVKYEEEKETPSPSPAPAPAHGLFNQLISNLVSSPRSSSQQQADQSEKKINGDVAGDSSTSNGGEVAEKGELVVADLEGGGDGDGSIIDDIVAQLPRTLSEDTAPATDEASILIHAIIHD